MGREWPPDQSPRLTLMTPDGLPLLVLLGCSLQAQAYYSLLWLLGEVVVEHKDVVGLAPEDIAQGVGAGSGSSSGSSSGSGGGGGGGGPVERRMDRCSSSVGNEGGWLSIATLRGGGRLVKALRHGALVEEFSALESATPPFWQRLVAEADVVVLNVGHHYHTVDKTFAKYARLAMEGAIHLERVLKPSAQLVFRTTNIGHYACENASRPLRSRKEAWEQLTSHGRDIWGWHVAKGSEGHVRHADMFKDKYHWRGPPLFEHEWAAAAHATGTLGQRFAFLNVSFMDARADGHVASSMRYSPTTGEFSGPTKTGFPIDCLHYCYPGPTDFWALSLYNLLLNNERYAGAATK